ncbi:MAG TPA: nicotinamidase [Burkholderiaceae bacterium]|nr:nicotinamidase [Burkholderiaceae bacterium]
MDKVQLEKSDALLVLDVQNDFLPGGALAVRDGDEVVPILNEYIALFVAQGLPVYATRDWHPSNHCSFTERGGPWPPHCIAGTAGAGFPPTLNLPKNAIVVSKAMDPDKEAYSGFDHSDLAEQLQRAGIRRVFIGGLTTDYCVRESVRDALAQGFQVELLVDATRAINVHPGDGPAAIREMTERGAVPIEFDNVLP